VLCVEVTLTISTWYHSTLYSSSGSFTASKMMFQVPRASLRRCELWAHMEVASWLFFGLSLSKPQEPRLGHQVLTSEVPLGHGSLGPRRRVRKPPPRGATTRREEIWGWVPCEVGSKKRQGPEMCQSLALQTGSLDVKRHFGVVRGEALGSCGDSHRRWLFYLSLGFSLWTFEK